MSPGGVPRLVKAGWSAWRELFRSALVALVWPFDSRVDTMLDVTHKPYWHDVAWWCSKVGEGWVVGVAGIIQIGIGRARVAVRQPRGHHAGRDAQALLARCRLVVFQGW